MRRVIHYDRNLGKGYAVKVGALEAHAALDRVSSTRTSISIPRPARATSLRGAEALDFAIGSKRHPDSTSTIRARAASRAGCYQQLVRVLFRLDVRDTQVGPEGVPPRGAEQVAAAAARQAVRVRPRAARGRDAPSATAGSASCPYRSTTASPAPASRSLAVLRALVDTAAIFYRLRILRYYQRKRALAGRTAGRDRAATSRSSRS